MTNGIRKTGFCFRCRFWSSSLSSTMHIANGIGDFRLHFVGVVFGLRLFLRRCNSRKVSAISREARGPRFKAKRTRAKRSRVSLQSLVCLVYTLKTRSASPSILAHAVRVKSQTPFFPRFVPPNKETSTNTKPKQESRDRRYQS